MTNHPMPMAGMTPQWAYRNAIRRARLALTWADKLDGLKAAERARHRILAGKGRYRLSLADYDMSMVSASAMTADVRRALGAC